MIQACISCITQWYYAVPILILLWRYATIPILICMGKLIKEQRILEMHCMEDRAKKDK